MGGTCDGSWAGEAAWVLLAAPFCLFYPKTRGKRVPRCLNLTSCGLVPGGAEMTEKETWNSSSSSSPPAPRAARYVPNGISICCGVVFLAMMIFRKEIFFFYYFSFLRKPFGTVGSLCFVGSSGEGGLQKGAFLDLISWAFLAGMGFVLAACPTAGIFTSSA